MSVGSMLQFHRVAMHTLTLLLQLEGHLLLSTAVVSSALGFKVSVPLWIPRTATSDSTPQLQLVVLQVGWARMTQYDPVRV